MNRISAAFKSFNMRFQRGVSWMLLPRTRVDYSQAPSTVLQNSIVVGVLNWATRNFSEAPWRIQKKKVVGKKVEFERIFESDTGPGRVLQLLEEPNEWCDGDTLMKAVLVDWITRANAYVVKVRSGNGRVEELYWLPAWMVEPWWPPEDPTVFIQEYRYTVNGEVYAIPTADMIHFKDGIDPMNVRKGLNGFASLYREIFTDDEAANFSAALLNNLGIPGVILSPEDSGIASRNRVENPENVRDKFNERFTGDGRGGVMVLTSPTKVQMLAYNPQQLTLKDLRRLPEERVASVIGIPAILAGLGAGLDRSTYSNMAEAREAGYEEFIIPTQRTMGRILKKNLLADFANPLDYQLDKDYSEVRVLQEDQTNLFTRWAAALASGGVTRRAFKEAIGEEADDKDDVYYIPANVDVMNAEEPPPDLLADQPPEPTPQDVLGLPQVRPQVTAGNGNGNGNGGAPVPA